MKLLKELFSFDDYDSNEEYGMGEDEQEFDFDFDFEKPGMEDEELDFEHNSYSDDEMEDDEFEGDYGAEEDYPEGMMDMPHDEYEEDGEGGLVSDEGMEEELGSIKDEIESLYARLGKLAAVGDLELADDADSFEDVDMGDEDPDFASFRDMDFDDDDDDFGDERMDFDDDDFDFDDDDEGLPLDRPEFR